MLTEFVQDATFISMIFRGVFMMYTVNLRIFGRSAGRGMKALGLCAETAIFPDQR